MLKPGTVDGNLLTRKIFSSITSLHQTQDRTLLKLHDEQDPVEKNLSLPGGSDCVLSSFTSHTPSWKVQQNNRGALCSRELKKQKMYSLGYHIRNEEKYSLVPFFFSSPRQCKVLSIFKQVFLRDVSDKPPSHCCGKTSSQHDATTTRLHSISFFLCLFIYFTSHLD